MKKITTFRQIKEIIEPIPADKFCTELYENDEGQSCFLGHINKHINGICCRDITGCGARQLTRNFIDDVHKINKSGLDVNNESTIGHYTEPIIKDRLMHMIEDGIKWEKKKKSLLELKEKNV